MFYLLYMLYLLYHICYVKEAWSYAKKKWIVGQHWQADERSSNNTYALLVKFAAHTRFGALEKQRLYSTLFRLISSKTSTQRRRHHHHHQRHPRNHKSSITWQHLMVLLLLLCVHSECAARVGSLSRCSHHVIISWGQQNIAHLHAHDDGQLSSKHNCSMQRFFFSCSFLSAISLSRQQSSAALPLIMAAHFLFSQA